MLAGFVGRILPKPPATRAGQLFWALFLLLGPLAYIGGTILEERGLGRTIGSVAVDRDSALATGAQFAVEHKLDASAWNRYVSVNASKDLLDYYRIHREPAAVAAQVFSSPVKLEVILVSEKGGTARVILNRAGQVAGFNFTRVKSLISAESGSQEDQLPIARSSIESIPGLAGVFPLGKPEVKHLDRTGKGCNTFTWTGPSSTLPGLTFTATSAVCGTTVIRQTVESDVNGDYASAHWGRAARPLTILIVVYGLYIGVVVIYAIFRYARRSVEREVSHWRTIVLAFTIAAAMTANFLGAIDEYVYGLTVAGQGIMWYPIVAVALSFLVMGLGVAIAYGAGEGDLREFYPGKITSLDALMRGKLFSRNVGCSAIFGVALAAWMLLAQGAADAILKPNSGALTAELLKVPFFRTPLLAIFVGQAVTVTLIPASGLLLPLAFLGRNVHRTRLRRTLIVLFAVLGSLWGVSHYGSVGSAAIGVAAGVAMLLGGFFGMDLLASIFCVGAFHIATSLARLIVLSPSWVQLGAAVSLIGLGFLAAETWAALRGREYREEEVRPLYAGNIAARQSMQAEMAAAREAQLHLLPKAAPEIAGLSISASCVPARTVGGDFYDFFPLGGSRLGIFIAEGENRGVGSALNIALAKGFLMHTVRRNLSPREIVHRLESTLGPLLERAGAATHVAYVVIDASAGTLRYARTGDYPRVLTGAGLMAEQRVEIPGSSTVIYEGSASLAEGDTVLLFTDGIARRVRTSGPNAAQNILKTLARKHREHELEDDLTAVVVRVTGVDAAMEVVA